MNVLVLGSGPAGLVATHAARSIGAKVEIISLGRRSPLHGAQYLHAPIPDVPGVPHKTVVTEFQGSVAEYRHKVYGEGWKGAVSPQQYSGPADAWDIRTTYDYLWDRYQRLITPFPLDGEVLQTFVPVEDYDIIFSTIPAKTLCINESHSFGVQKVWAAGDAPEWRVTCPVRMHPETIVLDGTRERGWYRAANVFGHCTVEWPWNKGKKPPFEDVAEIRKPLVTNCDCWPNFIRLGRYGKWAKGELVHTVYNEALTMMKARVN